MLPWILGAVVGVVYILENAGSENERTRDKYYNTLDRARRDTQKAYENAQKKDMLDKLFKVKKAKKYIADSIYEELSNSRSSFKQINMQLKESKDTLAFLFSEKKLARTKENKIDIQTNINILIDSRKELFKIRDELKSDIDALRVKLSNANKEVRDIQNEINLIL